MSTDDELMRTVQSGRIEALGDLFERHSGLVAAYCSRTLGSRAQTDDLTQEVFFRVLKYRASYRGDSRFTTWLFRIAYHVCLDASTGSREVTAEPWESPSIIVDGEATPAERAERQQELAQVFAALAELPPETRKLIELRWFQGLRYVDIAKRLGCQESAARVRAHRALCLLRDRLKGRQAKESKGVPGELRESP